MFCTINAIHRRRVHVSENNNTLETIVAPANSNNNQEKLIESTEPMCDLSELDFSSKIHIFDVGTSQEEYQCLISELDHQLIVSHSESKTIRKNLSDYKQHYDQLQNELNAERQENFALRQQVNTLNELIDKLDKKEPNSDLKHEPADNNSTDQVIQALQQKHKHQIDKYIHLIQDKDARISELESLNFSYKKMALHKQELEATLYAERQKIVTLEQQQVAAEELASERMELELKLIKAQGEAEQLTMLQNEWQVKFKVVEKQWLDSYRKSQQLAHDLAQTNAKKQDAIEELTALCQQFEQLKNKVINGQNQLELRSQELIASKQAIELLKQDRRRLEEQVMILQEHTEKKEGIIGGLHKEIHDLRIQLDHLSCEKAEKIRFAEQCDHLSMDLKATQERLEEAHLNKLTLEQQIQQLHSTLMEKEHHLGEQAALLSTSAIEKKEFQEIQRQLRNQLEEQDLQLKMSHQNLAKKVMEIAHLHERVDEQKIQLSELQTLLHQTQENNAELRTTIEKQQEQEKHIQELLKATIKSSETQLKQWEEKYLQLHDKYQYSEARQLELKTIAEKYQQMQSLLTNFGAFLGTPNLSSHGIGRDNLSKENLARESSGAISGSVSNAGALLATASIPSTASSNNGFSQNGTLSSHEQIGLKKETHAVDIKCEINKHTAAQPLIQPELFAEVGSAKTQPPKYKRNLFDE